jgi:hypothetical protein
MRAHPAERGGLLEHRHWRNPHIGTPTIAQFGHQLRGGIEVQGHLPLTGLLKTENGLLQCDLERRHTEHREHFATCQGLCRSSAIGGVIWVSGVHGLMAN